MMKNKELFTLNPEEVNLRNEGVAKLRTINESDDLSIAEYELKTFVCEGEYHDGLKKILNQYLSNYDNKEQPSFWVSGFYGSGKSHLVKMASYLWNDFVFPNGKTARNIRTLPQDIHDLFVELDRKQKIQGKLSIAGTLRDFPSSDIRYSFIQLLLNNLGLPSQYHHFKFVYWAKTEGIYDDLESLVKAAGKDLKKEIENMFVSSVLAKSVLELRPELAENEMKLKETFRAQFPRIDKIGRIDFVKTIREEILPLSFGDKIPCTLIVLDEVQQFIGQDAALAENVQYLAEDLGSRFDGKFVLVGTGQSALRDTPTLQRLLARFRVPIQLTNTDIQTVIRKTILDKKPSTYSELNKKLENSLGEISRNLQGTKYGYLTEDKETLVADYPLMPSTRKLWGDVLEVIDVAGTSGQLRNQLRVIDDSLKSIAALKVGNIVPADFIFDQNQTQLIQLGLLMNDTCNLIQGKKSQGGDSQLEGRILSAVFLLDQITSNKPNTGLKSNENTIADLLIDNLNEDSNAFRTKIKTLIEKLKDDKVLMPINDEYKLQTKIGTEWEQEFTKQYIKLNNSGDDKIQSLRREKLIAYFKEKTRGVNITQGTSRIPRDYELWDKNTAPNTEQKLNLWIRDGWFENDSSVENEIRAAGSDAPLAYAFVKKNRDAELRTEIVKHLAADLTIAAMGIPSTPEGQQARRSMDTRKSQSETAIKDLIVKICDDTTVYLAGGNKVVVGNVKDNIQSALNSIADRQFPEFKSKADYSTWGQALTKAVAGNPDALISINYRKEIEKHPIAVEILRYLGNSTKTGRDIRTYFMKSPYGWYQDAIDTLLIMLINTQYISTTETDLKPGKINQASFKKEIYILGALDKIAIRKLFKEATIICPPNKDIFPYSNEFIEKLKTLASQVSGDSPKPEPINTSFIKEIENKEGNERLLEILQQKDVLEAKLKEWSAKAILVSEREPNWRLLVKLTTYLKDEPELEQLEEEVEAIRENRLLLKEPDLVFPLLNVVNDKLLTILNQRKAKYNELYDKHMEELQNNEDFKKLTPEQKRGILINHQLLIKPEIKSHNAQALLNELQKASLYTWITKIAALPNQFQSALEEAILLLTPKARTYSLPRKTIKNQAEIESYIAELKTELETLLKESKSIILK